MGNEKNYRYLFSYYTALHLENSFYCNVSSIVYLVENMVITWNSLIFIKSIQEP